MLPSPMSGQGASRAKRHSINPIERLNGEVGIFPNGDAIVRRSCRRDSREHDLVGIRHTVATELRELGFDTRMIADMLDTKARRWRRITVVTPICATS